MLRPPSAAQENGESRRAGPPGTDQTLLHTSISALCSLSKVGLLQLSEGVTLPEHDEESKGGQEQDNIY